MSLAHAIAEISAFVQTEKRKKAKYGVYHSWIQSKLTQIMRIVEHFEFIEMRMAIELCGYGALIA